jgi:hypothetical protein
VRNRGIGRARMFVGGFLLFAAVITWLTALMMSPHGPGGAAGGENVRSVIVVFLRNSAIGTLVLTAVSAYLLFPVRRPRKPWRDRLLIGLMAVLVLTSVYELVWLQTRIVREM